jgi:hypothetical protein
MITCYLRYVVDPDKLEEFEAYARMWIPLVNKFGGTHHGIFFPMKAPITSRSRCSAFRLWRPTKNTEPGRARTQNVWRRWSIVERQNAFSASNEASCDRFLAKAAAT